MRNLLLCISLLLNCLGFGQYGRIDRSDTSIHVVQDYWYYQHWMVYPATSAVYVPPCIYRIVPPDTSLVNFESGVVDYREQYQLVEKQGKFGVINTGDTLVIPMVYDSLIRITNTVPKVFIARQGDHFGLLDEHNKTIIPFEYEYMYLLSNGHYFGLMNSSLSVVKNGKNGLMRVDGSIELSCSYDYIDVSCEQTDCPKNGLQYYVQKDGRFGFVNRDESIAIPFAYEDLNADGFSGLIRAKNDGKVGLMDTLEQFVLPQEYEQLYKAHSWRFKNLTAFKRDGKWGFMYGDYGKPTIIVDNVFDSVMTAYAFENHFIVINENKWGLADTTGKVVIAPQFDEIQAMDDGTFAYKTDGKWGFMNDKGMIHCLPRYDEIADNIKNWCLVRRDDGYGFCKTSGEQIAAPIYQAPYWDDYMHWDELLYTGHIAMSKLRDEDDYDCIMGVIDSMGKIVMPFEYDCLDELVYNFGQTLIAVKDNQEVIIDKYGNELDVGDYDEIEHVRYSYGYFFPKKGDKVGLVSPYGQVITKPKYNHIEPLHIGGEGLETKVYILVKMGSKFGLLDSNGTQILAPEHDALDIKYNDKVEVLSGNQVKIFNLITGKYESYTGLDDYQFNGQVGVFRAAGPLAFFIDKKGRRINDIDYQHIWSKGVRSNYFSVHSKGLIGICDSTGNEIFAPKFSKIKYWDGTFGAGKQLNRYCFFDAKGDTVVGYRYEKVKGVYKDFVCVKVKDKFGVVTRLGEWVLAPTLQMKLNFETMQEFGLTGINQGYKYGVVNDSIQVILEPIYEGVSFIQIADRSFVIAKAAEGYLLFDAEGNKLSDLLFNSWSWEADKVTFTGESGIFSLSEEGLQEKKQ